MYTNCAGSNDLEYQPPTGALVMVISAVLLAAALKSVSCRALVPNVPVLTSTTILPSIVNGLVGEPPAFLIFSVTDQMTAVSEMPLVSKDRIARYCFFVASSPTVKFGSAEFMVPPSPLSSDDSST